MRYLLVVLIVVPVMVIGGCAGMTETQQRTLTGGTAGAAGGAVIGAIAGNAGLGARSALGQALWEATSMGSMRSRSKQPTNRA